MTLCLFNNPVLKQICAPVEPGDDLDFIQEMRRLRRAHNGAGLAAPQAGTPKRVILVRDEAMINPVITWASEVKSSEQEGCLSYPGWAARIERPISVKVTFTDEAGNLHTDKQYTYFEARIVQHEMDHLQGVCLVGDRWRREAVRNAADVDDWPTEIA